MSKLAKQGGYKRILMLMAPMADSSVVRLEFDGEKMAILRPSERSRKRIVGMKDLHPTQIFR